jgi:nucleoside-diphosphate-sugar epimerase
MHVLVTGAAGMIGRKLAARLAADGGLDGQPIEWLTLTDIVAPQPPAGFTGRVETIAGDLTAPGTAESLVAARPGAIFHLAGVVSGEAELDLEKGYRVNLDGTRALLEAVRRTGDGYQPKVIFTSSMAVYGAHKVMCEQMLADSTRKGILQGVGIRLPSIVVRPGKPNRAASGFFSGIIREPLSGQEAILPVADTVLHTHASPRSAVGFLIHAAGLLREHVEPRINLTMPGVCCTVAGQIEALRRVAGERVAARVRREPDELVVRIVAGWPHRFEAKRARALGFKVESSFDEIIRVHIEEDRSGTFVT